MEGWSARDEQGRGGRVDVPGRVYGWSDGPGSSAHGDGGERLHAWMSGNGAGGEIDLGVHRQVDATVGAALIGRRTFDLGVGPWGGTPWPGIPSFVVTHRTRQDFLGDNGGTFAFDGMEAEVRRAKQAAWGDRDVLALGTDVARRLLRVGCSPRCESTSFPC